MSLLRYVLVTALAFVVSAWSTLAANTSNSTLSFQVSTGGNDNYFLRDNVTTAQLLLTSANNTSGPRRLVVAMPAGNSGALVYFLPLSANTSTSPNISAPANTTGAQPLSVSLVNGTLTSTTDEGNNVGVQADLAFSGNATLGVTIIGAVRAMRDYVEGNGTMHEIFNYTLLSHNSTSVRLHHRYINSTINSTIFRGNDLYLSVLPGSNTRLSVTPGNNGTFTPPIINILVPPNASSQSTLRVRVLTNETSLVGLDTQGLFTSEEQGGTPGLTKALQGLADGSNMAADQVSFLTYADKFTAGGWRFLTYFGRDSMIALRLLMPLLTSDAIEAALGAVIERANVTGALCHEETIGDYASFINMQNNQSNLGNTPFYDYKMIDTDLLLLPAVNHYFLELPQGKNRATQFLAKNATLQNGTYGDILNRISNYNVARALPFFRNSTATNLLAFRPGQPVGNWRDSNQGTGYGPIPFDVNSALVPASLRATAALISAKIVALPNVGVVVGEGQKPVDVGEVAGVWEEQAPSFFEVEVTREVAEERLVDFVAKEGLSAALLEQNVTSSAAGNVSFYALSLMADGTPVQVLNSDLGFNLMYGVNVSRTFLEHTINALTPYPRGLLTNIGMVVANPAYDSNRTNLEVLDRTAYHGTVVWSFQQGLMAGGLARQLGFCSSSPNSTVDTNPAPKPIPSWCADAAFVQSLRDAQNRLWTSVKGAQTSIFTEVWSYSFDNTTNQFSTADLATISPDGTESDAIQLWSYGFLGLLDPSGIEIGP